MTGQEAWGWAAAHLQALGSRAGPQWHTTREQRGDGARQCTAGAVCVARGDARRAELIHLAAAAVEHVDAVGVVSALEVTAFE